MGKNKQEIIKWFDSEIVLLCLCQKDFRKKRLNLMNKVLKKMKINFKYIEQNKEVGRIKIKV